MAGIMSTQPASYRKLLKRMREVSLLNSISCVIEWDQNTYMPPAAATYRAEQFAVLGERSHRLFTAGVVGGLLAECEQHGFAADSVEAANVREWRHHYERATKLPASFVVKFERTKALAYEAWREARAQSKFELFKPHLVKMVGLVRQKAEYLGYEASPYDALLEGYEPGARTERIGRLFGELRPGIVALLEQVRERETAPAAGFRALIPLRPSRPSIGGWPRQLVLISRPGGSIPRPIPFAIRWGRAIAGSRPGTTSGTSRFHVQHPA